MKKIRLAICGATGVVGRQMIRSVEERKLQYSEIFLFASARSKGQKLSVNGKEIEVEELTEESFKDRNIDIALYSAGGSTSKKFAPFAAKYGTIVIDNSSAWRMDPDVPLIVPEVNPDEVRNIKKGIIANPNCSTIQMVVALKPLYDYSRIKRIVVATYQAVSGAGRKGIADLMNQSAQVLNNETVTKQKFDHQIAFNCLPHIGTFTDNLYTDEELKMVNETRKIFSDNDIMVSPTTVRVPVHTGHSEVVNVEFEKEITVEKARELLKNGKGIVVIDNPEKAEYPLPIFAKGSDETYVGRIRKDIGVKNGLALWVVSDSLRKGAATNAVQIAELLIKNDIVGK